MKFFIKPEPGRPLQRWSALLPAAMLALAACSNNDYTEPPPPPPPPVITAATEVPPTAVASIPAYIAYLNTLAVTDTGEALMVNVTPPVDDAVEPTNI